LNQKRNRNKNRKTILKQRTRKEEIKRRRKKEVPKKKEQILNMKLVRSP
jgi:hypothetical protein